MLKFTFVLLLSLIGALFAQAQIVGKSISSFTTKDGLVLHKGDTVRVGKGSDKNGSFRYIFIPSNAFTGTPQKFFTSNLAGSAVLIKDLKSTESSMYGIQTVAVIKGEGLLNGCIVINPAEDAGEIRTKPVQSPTTAAITPVASANIADELIKLKQLLDAKVLTQAEFTAQKERLLKQQADVVPNKIDAISAKKQTDNDITFKLINAVGDKKNQTVTVSILLTNSAANKKDFNTQIKSCTSLDGEEFTLQSGMVGNDRYNKTLFTDAPIKATYIFSGILPKVDKIKLLPIPYYYSSPSSHYTEGQVELRDIPINWK